MKLQYCTKCLNVSTRPRITFNEEGVCNACQWAETKKTISWKARWWRLEELCNKYRCPDGSNWDVIVPCSGGKDGSYVAWKLKHDLGMHPLCVTLLPQAQTELGRQNLENFKQAGFDHMAITPDPQVYKRLAIKGFKEQGRPKMPFGPGISTVTIKIATKFKIPFIMYGEEGESEYGGADTQRYNPQIDRDYLVNYYYNGLDFSGYLNEFTRDELRWWLLPDEEEWDRVGLFPTHWSHYENWDSLTHLKLAKEKCGLQSAKETSIGTYTDYAQLDDVLEDIDTYLMFLKFGFGRTTSDVGIEIRAGRMTRDEGAALVKKHDGVFPDKYLPEYLDYFGMNESEFSDLIDLWANKDILEKINGSWQLRTE